MSLLHKKGHSTTKFYGVDYKILTYILTERMQKVLKQVTNTDQKGFVKSRFYWIQYQVSARHNRACQNAKHQWGYFILRF